MFEMRFISRFWPARVRFLSFIAVRAHSSIAYRSLTAQLPPVYGLGRQTYLQPCEFLFPAVSGFPALSDLHAVTSPP